MIQDLFPPSARVNRIVPKRTFIDKLGANVRMKEHFTRDVVSIEWFAKLAPSTLNMTDGLDVHEIAVFVVPLKTKECPDDIFVFIDKMMPRHLLFILQYEDEVCMLINYKQAVSGNSELQYKVVRTYRSPWVSPQNLTVNIHHHTMDGLYESLVRQIAGTLITSDAPKLEEAIEQTSRQEALLKEIAALEKKIAAEPQPQKKFLLHKQLTELKKKQQWNYKNDNQDNNDNIK